MSTVKISQYTGDINADSGSFNHITITGDIQGGLPSGLVSSSAQLSGLNTFTGSIQTEVNSLTAGTSSYLTSPITTSSITNFPTEVSRSAAEAGFGGGGFTPSLSTDITARNITASGDISASGTIIGSNLSGTNTGDQDLSTYMLSANTASFAVTSSNVLFGDITASGDISASGTISMLTASIGGGIFTSASLAGGGGFTPSLSTDITARSITASGDIWASGSRIYSDSYFLVNDAGSQKQLFTRSNDILYLGDITLDEIRFTAPLNVSQNGGHITASGNISASGDLSILGFPSVSSSLAAAGGGGFTPSLSTDIVARNITASANISASGNLYANDLYSYGDKFAGFFNGPAASPSISDTFAIGNVGSGSLYANKILAQEFRVISDTGTATHKKALSWGGSTGITMGDFTTPLYFAGTSGSFVFADDVNFTAASANIEIKTTTSGKLTFLAASEVEISGNGLSISLGGNDMSITSSGTIITTANISSSGTVNHSGLPTSEPSVTGSLWISGSSVTHPNSGYLMVFNP
jgi:hypothetical protein